MTDRKFPVAEVFGPTIQGEGVFQGKPSYFVRFGGCDFRCDWCDTPYAVLPNAVRANVRLTADEIIERLLTLPEGPQWVVITGGNPLLHDLADLITLLHERQFLVSVETQGTKFKNWILSCDSICVSPKPPSAGMANVIPLLDMFLESVLGDDCRSFRYTHRVFLKIVVFDQVDYTWAKMLHKRYDHLRMYLSAGNDAGRTVGNPSRDDTRIHKQVALDLINQTRWLTNRTMIDKDMSDVSVQSQQHVLLWGNDRGH